MRHLKDVSDILGLRNAQALIEIQGARVDIISIGFGDDNIANILPLVLPAKIAEIKERFKDLIEMDVKHDWDHGA